MLQFAVYLTNEGSDEVEFDLDQVSRIDMPEIKESYSIDVDLTYPNELVDNAYKLVEKLGNKEAAHNERLQMYNDQINDHEEEVREEYLASRDSNSWTSGTDN